MELAPRLLSVEMTRGALLIIDHLLLDTGHFVPWIKTDFCGVGTRVTSFDEASVDRGFISRRGVC